MQESKLVRLIDTFHSLEKKISLILIETGLSIPQFRILRLIDAEPGISMSELSRKLGVKKPTVAVQLKEMIKMEVVTITTAPHDKRWKQIFLTQTGENRVTNAYENLALFEKRNKVFIESKLIESIEKFLS